jgi:hypothetical protein
VHDGPDRIERATCPDPHHPRWEHDDVLHCLLALPRLSRASDADHDAARVVSRHPEQGWSLLCNGVVVFDDTGEIMPDGRCVAPHRPACRQWVPLQHSRTRTFTAA